MTPYELDVRDPTASGIAIVELAGELDLTNVSDVERRLGQIGGDGGLILVLNRVTFADSAALHMLFRVARRHRGDRQFGIVLEPTALVARALAIVGLDQVAPVRSTLEELVAEPTA